MRARGWGRVVNVSSMVTVGLVDRTAYGAAKAAPGVLLPGLGDELRRRDRRQLGRSPETELFPAAQSGRLGKRRPVPRRVAGGPVRPPEEIAAAIAFLLGSKGRLHHRRTLRVGSIGGA